MSQCPLEPTPSPSKSRVLQSPSPTRQPLSPGSCSQTDQLMPCPWGQRGVKGHPLFGHRLAPSVSPGSLSPCRLLAPPQTLRNEGADAPRHRKEERCCREPATVHKGVFLIQAVPGRDATTTQEEFKTPESKFQTFVSPHIQNSHQKCLLSTRKPKGTGSDLFSALAQDPGSGLQLPCLPSVF